MQRAPEVVTSLETGMVGVNGGGHSAPFGAVSKGLDAEGELLGIEETQETRYPSVDVWGEPSSGEMRSCMRASAELLT